MIAFTFSAVIVFIILKAVSNFIKIIYSWKISLMYPILIESNLKLTIETERHIVEAAAFAVLQNPQVIALDRILDNF